MVLAASMVPAVVIVFADKGGDTASRFERQRFKVTEDLRIDADRREMRSIIIGNLPAGCRKAFRSRVAEESTMDESAMVGIAYEICPEVEDD